MPCYLFVVLYDDGRWHYSLVNARTVTVARRAAHTAFPLARHVELVRSFTTQRKALDYVNGFGKVN
jgi:hypothetical protein